MPGNPWTAVCQASLYFTISQSFLKLRSIESVMPFNHLILYHPLLFLLSIFPTIRFFSNEVAFRIMWPKYCSFSFSNNPSNEYSGLINFSIDWFDLLSVKRNSPKNSQESSPTPWFEDIISSGLSLFYCPAFTSIRT